MKARLKSLVLSIGVVLSAIGSTAYASDCQITLSHRSSGESRLWTVVSTGTGKGRSAKVEISSQDLDAAMDALFYESGKSPECKVDWVQIARMVDPYLAEQDPYFIRNRLIQKMEER